MNEWCVSVSVCFVRVRKGKRVYPFNPLLSVCVSALCCLFLVLSVASRVCPLVVSLSSKSFSHHIFYFVLNSLSFIYGLTIILQYVFLLICGDW